VAESVLSAGADVRAVGWFGLPPVDVLGLNASGDDAIKAVRPIRALLEVREG
jgi:hypothetical protein